MPSLNKWELINFLRACGIEDTDLALQLKSMGVSDWKILAKYGINKKTYKDFEKEYKADVSTSKKVRKKGKFVSMKCPLCGELMALGEKRAYVCKCGYTISRADRKAERVRHALRYIEKAPKKNVTLNRIKRLTKSHEDEEVIKSIAELERQ